jgi:DNA-binding transcriptional LysR family regulator
METFEIRYFLAAASHQNLSRAAQQVAVSVPAISRAVARLEEELGTQLFFRVGRTVQLSPAGKKFQQEASRIIGLVDDLRAKFRPSQRSVPITIGGTEFGIAMFLPEIIRRLKHAGMEFTMEARVFPASKRVRQALVDGEVQLGVVSGATKFPGAARLSLGQFVSKTLVGEGHPLFKAAKGDRKITVEEALQYPFVSFSEALLGDPFEYSDLQDGWRDDKFARRIGLKTESIEVALRLIESGDYLGYLPFELAGRRPAIEVLRLTGCPYSCTTECHLVGRGRDEFSWMNRLFRVEKEKGSWKKSRP